MKHRARYAYVQARLQARHGQRPDEALWGRLQGVGDLAGFIQIARKTALRPWVLGLHASQGSHDIELALRRQFRSYVDGVSDWIPGRWGKAVRWVKRLPDLPALQQLLTAEPVPVWILDDPELRRFGSESPAARIEALENSDCAALIQAWKQGGSLGEGWLQHWQTLWPDNSVYRRGLEYFTRLFELHIQALHAESGVSSGARREALAQQLVVAFRRYSFQPTAVYAHLALTALDLERLRGNLARRALFPESTEQAL